MDGCPLGKLMREALGVPVAVNNDGKCCALGEYAAGALRGTRFGVVLAIGTGIGGGIVIDGKVLRGAHCFAGEFSFLRNDVTTAANMGNSFADSGGWRALCDAAVAEKGLPEGSPVDGRRVFEWIADGDKAVQRALDRYARAFDGQLINLQAVLDPMCRRSWQPTARRRLLWSSTTVTLPHGSGRSGRTADQPKKKGLHRPKRKVFVTSSGGYRQRADREASQSENPTTEKDSFNIENNTAGQYLCPVGLHTF